LAAAAPSSIPSKADAAIIYSTGEPLEGECVEFRLIYTGRLLSGNKPHPANKQAIRLQISPQIKRLLECKPVLRRHCCREAFKWFKDHPEDAKKFQEAGLSDDDARVVMYDYWIRWMTEKWDRRGHGFVPLITEEMDIRCSLDILFLRPSPPGKIIDRTDLDNRLKTLIDALKVPDTAEGLGESSDEPIYCLLEDDRLISEIKVVSDQLLLLPGEKTVTENDVFLVISVVVESPASNLWHQAFG
jgi:hypothetical protein